MNENFTKYKRYIKLNDGTYQLISHWTSSNTVHFEDGNTAQSKLGAINGITDSLTSDSSNVALSAVGGKNLQTQISNLNTSLVYIEYGEVTLQYINSTMLSADIVCSKNIKSVTVNRHRVGDNFNLAYKPGDIVLSDFLTGTTNRVNIRLYSEDATFSEGSTATAYYTAIVGDNTDNAGNIIANLSTNIVPANIVESVLYNQIKKSGNCVFINFALKTFEEVSRFTPLSTIPVGYRPSQIIHKFPCTLRNSENGETTSCCVTIDTNGSVSMETTDILTGYDEIYVSTMYITE